MSALSGQSGVRWGLVRGTMSSPVRSLMTTCPPCPGLPAIDAPVCWVNGIACSGGQGPQASLGMRKGLAGPISVVNQLCGSLPRTLRRCLNRLLVQLAHLDLCTAWSAAMSWTCLRPLIAAMATLALNPELRMGRLLIGVSPLSGTIPRLRE